MQGQLTEEAASATAANAFDHSVKRRVLAIDWIVRVTHQFLLRGTLIAPQLAVAERCLWRQLLVRFRRSRWRRRRGREKQPRCSKTRNATSNVIGDRLLVPALGLPRLVLKLSFRNDCRGGDHKLSPARSDAAGGERLGPAFTSPMKVSRPPLQAGGLFLCSCQARRSVGSPSPPAGFEVRSIPSAGKTERSSAVRTVFERPGG